MKKLSIIIPTYNEAKTIDTVLTRVFGVELPGWQKEVIVVDDGSKDDTRMKLKKWEKKVTLIITYHIRQKSGKGVCSNERASDGKRRHSAYSGRGFRIQPV